jgi:hypothetical protein
MVVAEAATGLQRFSKDEISLVADLWPTTGGKKCYYLLVASPEIPKATTTYTLRVFSTNPI